MGYVHAVLSTDCDLFYPNKPRQADAMSGSLNRIHHFARCRSRIDLSFAELRRIMCLDLRTTRSRLQDAVAMGKIVDLGNGMYRVASMAEVGYKIFCPSNASNAAVNAASNVVCDSVHKVPRKAPCDTPDDTIKPKETSPLLANEKLKKPKSLSANTFARKPSPGEDAWIAGEIAALGISKPVQQRVNLYAAAEGDMDLLRQALDRTLEKMLSVHVSEPIGFWMQATRGMLADKKLAPVPIKKRFSSKQASVRKVRKMVDEPAFKSLPPPGMFQMFESAGDSQCRPGGV